MQLAIVISSVIFFLQRVPGGHQYIDFWTNVTTDEAILFSTERSSFDGVYRSLLVRSGYDKVDYRRSPYREIDIFCMVAFTFELLARLATSKHGPEFSGYLNFMLDRSNATDFVSRSPALLFETRGEPLNAQFVSSQLTV